MTYAPVRHRAESRHRAPSLPTSRAWLRRITEPSGAETRLGLIGLTLLAALSVVVPGVDVIRAPLVFSAAVLVPGAALLEVLPRRVLRDRTWPTWLAVSCALSFASVMLGSLVMAWTFDWHPGQWLAALAVGSTAALALPRSQVTPPVEFRRPDGASLAVLGLVAGAVVLWALSLGDIPTTGLSDYGLPPQLPLLWYAGLACAVVAALAALVLSRSDGVAGTAVGSVVLVLFGTLPALGGPPQYSWVYKHIGVVQYIEAGHGAEWFNGDIYQRWPGFFTTAAVIGQVAGRPDPVTFAAWSEPFFALVDALLVLALARALRLGRTACWGAALLFAVANWVGQTYFSPQALAFALHLAFLVVLLQWTEPTTDRSLLTHVLDSLQPWKRRDGRRGAPVRVVRPPHTALAVLVLLQVCIAVTHQLTPYLLALELAALAVVTPVRPRWLWPVIAAIPILYLLPNVGFIQDHFGLFSSFDISRNVQRTQDFGEVPSAGKALNGLASRVLSFAMWAATLLALLVRLRARRWNVRVLTALFFSPFLLVLAQDYGGEASLRVFLFTVPWAALAVSAAALDGTRRVWRASWAAFLLAVVVLFVPTFYGAAELNLMAPDEVRASAEVYRIGRVGGAFVLAGPNFPRSYSAEYGKFGYSAGEDIPSLLRDPYFRGRPLGSKEDVDKVVEAMQSIAPYGFVAFATSGYVYSDVFNLTPPGQLENLERAVAADPRFTLALIAADVRVYSLGDAVLPGVSIPVRVAGTG